MAKKHEKQVYRHVGRWSTLGLPSAPFISLASLHAVLTAACLLSMPLPGAAQVVSFKTYGQNEGLNNLAVNAMLQDRDGFLWFATQNGVFRYDGRMFRSYKKEGGLQGLRGQSLYESADGTLWVG